MLRRSLWQALGSYLALTACTAPGNVPATLAQFLTLGPEERPARLWVDGNRIVGAAVDLGPGALPAAVRTALDAIAPRGTICFEGREWGPRGNGFRIDKQYRIDATIHTRSALIAEDGTVLERCHSVPIAETPQSVLATAMQIGTQIDEVQIVSGRELEEAWRCQVTDRLGHHYLVTIGLDGTLRQSARRVTAQIDV